MQEVLTYFLQMRARRPLAGAVATGAPLTLAFSSRMLNADRKSKDILGGRG
jgi:hypothetical protein